MTKFLAVISLIGVVIGIFWIGDGVIALMFKGPLDEVELVVGGIGLIHLSLIIYHAIKVLQSDGKDRSKEPTLPG